MTGFWKLENVFGVEPENSENETNFMKRFSGKAPISSLFCFSTTTIAINIYPKKLFIA